MYILIHKKSDDGDTKFIGVFKEKEHVEKIVNKYKQIEGFELYPNDFSIIKVPILDGKQVENGQNIYLLQTYEWDEEEFDAKNLIYHGGFIDKKNAIKYIDAHKEIKTKDRKTDISTVEINRCEWKEGCVRIEY